MAYPKVSIVIPSYKVDHFEACLRSAIGQSYPNIEITVSDNCPTEGIREICARYPHVIYQRNTATRSDNVLSAIYAAKGDFIKPLFDDDVLHPFCVERMVAAFQGRDDVTMVFSASQVIDIANQRIETRRPYEASGTIGGLQLQRSMTLGMCNYVGEYTTIMFRRTTLWKIAPHDLFKVGSHDCTRGLADVATYYNLTAGASAFYIDEELSYFRRDPALQSNSNINANPYFGYCFSDYLDLLLAAHETGVITTEELVATESRAHAVSVQLSGVFEQVGRSYERFHTYVQPLKE